MTSPIASILLVVIGITSLTCAAQKPVKEDAMWVDGSPAPPAVADMVAQAEIVVVAIYRGERRPRPDLRADSPASSLHRFETVDVIKSTAPLPKPDDSFEVEMLDGITQFPTHTLHTGVHDEEPLLSKHRYVLFLNHLPERAAGNYVKAWGNAGEGIYDVTAEPVRPLSTARQEHRGKLSSSFLDQVRRTR